MNFSTDRDLLVLEPSVFHDVAIAAQQRITAADAAVTGTTLTSAGSDFVAAGVGPGSVVLISQIAHEVLMRVDAHTLTISLPRRGLADAAIPGPAAAQGTGLELIARTFAPQAAAVHHSLLNLLGVEPEGADDAAITEDDIVSLSVMARLESLATLERIYAAAATLEGDNDILLHKAQFHRQRFQHAIRTATILLDTDHDGRADRRWRLGQLRLTRA